jgi:hypothetical protein
MIRTWWDVAYPLSKLLQWIHRSEVFAGQALVPAESDHEQHEGVEDTCEEAYIANDRLDEGPFAPAEFGSHRR